MIKLNVPFEKLKRIYHLADIHIRLFHRHEEYRSAFQHLYTQYDELNSDGMFEGSIIVLAGDILHAKNDMSPEMVMVTSEFLQKISLYAPTIMIAGNHDCNLANTHRLDALTPIVDSLGISNLHYIRNSEIVRVGDTDISVLSILDEQEKWPSVNDCEMDTKIALYHGPVHGALTGANFTVTNRHVNVNTFDGYDMVLLGDIHSHQLLQDYDKPNNKPIIVYPGSLIQQNHGESLDGHGWCLWDVEKRTFAFVPLENDYGYATIEVKNNKVSHPANMPKYVRARLITENMDTTQIKKLITILRKKFNIIELGQSAASKMSGQGSTSQLNIHETLDLTNVSTQNQLIQDWLLRKQPTLDTEVIGLINKLNREINSKIEHDDQSRNINWRPLVFKFSNMFSYGEDNEINFADMNGLYGIFAPNASGKSSVMDALMFCLYDKTPRAFKGDHIINNRKDKFECELTFEINGVQYGIKRIGNRKKNGDVKVDVQFWRVTDTGELQSLNGEDRRDTNSNIRTYVGTYEDFVMTALSGQTSNALFIDKSHSERKDLLIQFMGLNIFDKLFDTANEEAKEMTGVLKRFKKSEVTDEISQTHIDLSEAQQHLSGAEERYEELKTERELLDELLIKTQSQKRPVPKTTSSISSLNKELQTAERSFKNNTEKTDTIKEQIVETTNEYDEYTSQLQSYDIPSLEKSVARYNKLTEDVKSHEHAIKVTLTSIKEREKVSSTLSAYKYNPDCNVCLENNKTVISDLDRITSELEKLNSKLETQKSALIAIKSEMDTLVEDKNNYSTAITLQKDIQSAQQELLQLNSELQSAQMVNDKLTNQMIRIQSDIEVYKQNEEAILYNNKIDEEMATVQQQISDNKKEYQKIEQTLRVIHGNISSLETKKKELVDRLKEAEQLEATYEAYNHYLAAIGRNGVPYELMSKAIPQIEAEINGILTQIVDFTVSLEVDEKNINGKLTYDYDKVWPLENSSGMERFVTSLAIRVALLKASNLPKSNFLIIDEGFGVLDTEHLHSMQTLFNILKTHFDFILIVSHLDTARDMVDNLIEIRKEDGYSQISV